MLPRKLAAALVLALAAAHAEAASKDVGNVQVTDVAGAVTDVRDINPAGNWIVILLDADKPASRAVVLRLRQADVDWNDRLVVVTQGNVTAAQTLRVLGQPLKHVRWYSSQDTEPPTKSWGLGGTPAILAVQGNGRIVNASVGFTESADRNIAMMRNWIGNTP